MKYEIIDRMIGEALRDGRTRNGFTIREMANKMSIGKTTYKNYEDANRSIPVEKLKEACMILGLDYIDILRDAQQTFLRSLEEEDHVG